MTPPRTAFTALPACHFEDSAHFYRDLLGLAVIDEGEDALGRFIHFDTGGHGIRIFEWTDDFNHAPHSGLQLYVEDVDAWHEKLKAAKVLISGGVRDEPWGGRTVTVLDPDGNRFDLLNEDFEKAIGKSE